MKGKYPMKSGPFLGLVIDYEKLTYLQATNICEPNRVENKKVKTKTRTRNGKIKS